MKKLAFTVLFVVALIFQCQAQRISKNALGVRLGDDDGFDSLGAEISYQLNILESNRLEFDLGFRGEKDVYDAFKLIGLFQWVMPLDRSFHWYVGAGAGMGNVDFDNGGSNSFAVLAGNIGIEYNFKIPIILSVDARPEFGLGDDDIYGDGFDFDLGLGIRYQFWYKKPLSGAFYFSNVFVLKRFVPKLLSTHRDIGHKTGLGQRKNGYAIFVLGLKGNTRFKGNGRSFGGKLELFFLKSL